MRLQKRRANTNQVWIVNQSRRRLLRRPLTDALRLTMKGMKLRRSTVSLTLVDSKTIQRLNQQYRKKNRPTDVLSFSYNLPVSKKDNFLGDIVISPAVAAQNAKEDGKTVKEEMVLLAVHGLLHLLGYDHEKPNEAKKMFALQKKWVKKALTR